MNLTVRQWAIVAALAAGFLIAAVSVAGDGSDANPSEEIEFDEVVWCESANAISRWGGILDGSADGDDPDSITNLRVALDNARAVAPFELRVDIARLTDLVLLVGQQIDQTDTLAAALEAGSAQTDQARVADAVGAVSEAILACGHDPILD